MHAFHLHEAIDLLERTPHVLRALATNLPAAWVESRQNANSWSPADIVAHLIHGESTDWVVRLQIILEHGESVPFAPFDPSLQAQYRQAKRLEELLDRFAALRAQNLQALRDAGISRQQLQARGVHPALGSVTVSELLSTWVVHDLNHLNQMTRALAARYREDVGPWNHRSYLPILHDAR